MLQIILPTMMLQIDHYKQYRWEDQRLRTRDKRPNTTECPTLHSHQAVAATPFGLVRTLVAYFDFAYYSFYYIFGAY
jgi:hypothetical protein